jgi:hypothetical protein
MKKERDRNIPVYQCDSAKEIVDTLSITSNIWEDHEYSTWYIRGQGRSSWKLEPSILRNVGGLKSGPHVMTRKNIFYKEYQNMQLFKKIADEAGLSVPGDSQLFRTFEGAEEAVSKRLANLTWPPIEALDTLAFIQHHGIPTRLLDFTYNPFVALFFAAKQGLEELDKATDDDFNICIWAINRVSLTHIKTMDTKNPYSPRYLEITTPYAANEYLKKQQGVFLLDSCFAKDIMNYRTIDEVISEELGKNKLVTPGFCCEPVKKIEINISEAKTVLLLLKKMHISLASLMPSFDNVKRHIDFYRSIDKKQYLPKGWLRGIEMVGGRKTAQ